MTIESLKFQNSDFTGQTVSELPNIPSQGGFDGTAVKARMDNIGKVLIALGNFNDLIDALLATTDGSSGGDSIGMTAIPGVTGTTAQAIAESLKSLIDAAVTGNIPDNSLGNIKLATDAKVGSLATLTTTEKGSAVGAINELDDIISTVSADVDTLSKIIGIKRYGFRRTKANSDPNTRIEYLYDAVGLTPAYMDTAGGTFNNGDWGTFINEVSRPVMLKTDGTVDYELLRTDFTKKSDGITASDVSNTAYAGNAMIEFKKYKWVCRYEDATYEYVIFSNTQYDANYHAYAHQNALGTIKDAFYWGAFKGSNISSKLRSIADQSVMVSQTRNTEVSYAQANGSGYDTIYKSGWDFICDLLTLISKSDASQAKFGTGRSKTTNTTAIATGTLKALPTFKGYTDETSDVKVFGIEGFWGNVWEGMAGLVYNGNIKAKMAPPYNFDGTGYYDTGLDPSGTSGGYVNTASVTDEAGYIPKTASGSGTTYYCDGLYFNNAQVDYALVGGYWGGGLLDGSRYVRLNALASDVHTGIGSRLSYLNPA